MSFHGGMVFLPLRTELKKRARSSWGNLRRSNEPFPGLTMRGPWQCEQMCLKMSEPSSNCAFEGGPFGIRCNTLSMDSVRGTRMIEQNLAREENPQPKGPLGRWVWADDIAEAIAFLASDRARAITGQILDVNAGFFMRT